MDYIKQHPKLTSFGALLIAFFLMVALVPQNEGNYLWRFPSLLAWLPGWINDFAEFLMFDFMPVEIYDADLDDYETSALLREITRGFSGIVLVLIEFIREMLIGGRKTIVLFTSWDFVRDNPWAV
jgi:glycine betaine/proline transport system permease protein